MKIKDLDKNKIYIIGVSGGMDSMVLLDMVYKYGLNIVVAHVNYQKRSSADRDMDLVKAYEEGHLLYSLFLLEYVVKIEGLNEIICSPQVIF